MFLNNLQTSKIQQPQAKIVPKNRKFFPLTKTHITPIFYIHLPTKQAHPEFIFLFLGETMNFTSHDLPKFQSLTTKLNNLYKFRQSLNKEIKAIREEIERERGSRWREGDKVRFWYTQVQVKNAIVVGVRFEEGIWEVRLEYKGEGRKSGKQSLIHSWVKGKDVWRKEKETIKPQPSLSKKGGEFEAHKRNGITTGDIETCHIL